MIRIQNEKLQRALERKVKVDTNEKTNSCLSGQVERYKEVIYNYSCNIQRL